MANNSQQTNQRPKCMGRGAFISMLQKQWASKEDSYHEERSVGRPLVQLNAAPITPAAKVAPRGQPPHPKKLTDLHHYQSSCHAEQEKCVGGTPQQSSAAPSSPAATVAPPWGQPPHRTKLIDPHHYHSSHHAEQEKFVWGPSQQSNAAAFSPAVTVAPPRGQPPHSPKLMDPHHYQSSHHTEQKKFVWGPTQQSNAAPSSPAVTVAPCRGQLPHRPKLMDPHHYHSSHHAEQTFVWGPPQQSSAALFSPAVTVAPPRGQPPHEILTGLVQYQPTYQTEQEKFVGKPSPQSSAVPFSPAVTLAPPRGQPPHKILTGLPEYQSTYQTEQKCVGKPSQQPSAAPSSPAVTVAPPRGQPPHRILTGLPQYQSTFRTEQEKSVGKPSQQPSAAPSSPAVTMAPPRGQPPHKILTGLPEYQSTYQTEQGKCVGKPSQQPSAAPSPPAVTMAPPRGQPPHKILTGLRQYQSTYQTEQEKCVGKPSQMSSAAPSSPAVTVAPPRGQPPHKILTGLPHYQSTYPTEQGKCVGGPSHQSSAAPFSLAAAMAPRDQPPHHRAVNQELCGSLLHPVPPTTNYQAEAACTSPSPGAARPTSQLPKETKLASKLKKETKPASKPETEARPAEGSHTKGIETGIENMGISEDVQAEKESEYKQLAASIRSHRFSADKCGPSAKASYSLLVKPNPPRKLPPGWGTVSVVGTRKRTGVGQRAEQTLPEKKPLVPGTPPPSLTGSSSPAVESNAQDHQKQTPSSSKQSDSTCQTSSGQKSQSAPIIMKGSSGQLSNISCNYVKINWEPGMGVFIYDVKFNPEVDSIVYRKDLIKQFEMDIGLTRSFDGLQLQLPVKLPQLKLVLVGKLPSDGSDVEITIRFKKETLLSERVQLLNALLRRAMNLLGLSLIGRNFFDPASAKPIPTQRLQVWPGYVTSIDEFEGGVFLCCDASHRVLRTETVLELMQDMRSTLGDDATPHFIDLVVGKSVLTRYNNRVYRVDDIDFSKNPLDTFSTSDGDISYVAYYKKSYGLNISNLKQPLIVSRRKLKLFHPTANNFVYLIPEFCYITGLSDEMRNDMKVMKDIASFTRISPFERLLTLRKFIKNINSNTNACKLLSAWGVSIEDATLGLPGRILVPETIHFGDKEVPGSLQADWSRATSSSHVLSVVDLKNWAVVYPRREEKLVKDFIQMCLRCAQPLGIQVSPPAYYTLNSDSLDQYVSQIKRLMTPQVQLVMCILSTPRADKYSAIKKFCCLEVPVASQVMLIRTIRRYDRIRAVAHKVLLQINCKLGGTLWAVRIPVKNAMICGIDTYHDARQTSKSVVALVSSLNPSFTRWYSSVSFQDVGHELGEDLLTNFTSAIIKNSEVCGNLPDPIIIFRDGVGDGELKQCREVEFTALFEACQIIDADYKPKILFVVVQKRIHTRLFYDQETGVGNPPPGTIMDHTITRRNWFDFFLVSQSTKQGTVSPTHYVVVQNSTVMLPDHVQRLSYKLTHLYYNWPGTVRVPAPCQYAHKLAFLIGESVHSEVNEILRDKLYYL